MQSPDTESLVYFKIVPALAAHKNRIIGGFSAVVLIILLFLLLSWHKDQKEVNAGQAFSQLWVSAPPGTAPVDLASQYFKIAADYADTLTGQRALLQGAAILFSAGNYADAQTQFQKFVDTYPNSALIATALLGVASSQEAQGNSEASLGAYRKILDGYTDAAILISAKFATARIYEQEGKVVDALRNYQEIARSAPSSALGQQASLKAVELAATLPKTPVAPAPAPAASFPMMPPSK